MTYRRASAQRLVASSTASTELRSALSRISHVPVRSWASRPPSPCTATRTNLRSNASTSWAPSSATELSARSSSRHNDAARAAASTRLRAVSVPCSSASASFPSNESRPRTTTRLLARVRTASSCNCSIGRTSAVCATLILRWSIFIPSCAISADSMLRTTCLGCTSLMVRTWISLTSPSGVTTTRADRTPVRLVSRFSARLTPHGSGPPAPPVPASPPCPAVVRGSDSRSAPPSGVTLALSRCHLVPSRSLGAVQRAVGRHQHVLGLGADTRHELRHPDARGHERLGIAEAPPHRLHADPHFLRHSVRTLHRRADQHQHELVAAVARREVGRADVRAALARRAPQHFVPRLVAELVVHLLEVVQVHEQQGERIARPVAPRHLASQPVPQHAVGGESGERVHRRLKLRLLDQIVEIGRARLERRPP